MRSMLKLYEFASNPKLCPKKYRHLYNQAYLFWKKIIIDTLPDQKFYSDVFMQQDLFLALFYKNNPIGCYGLSWYDLSIPAVLDLQYFAAYPDNIIKKYILPHKIIMGVYFMAVDHAWRKNAGGPGISDILTGLSSLYFIKSPATMMIYLTRNNRKVNNLGIRHGGVLLQSNYIYNNMAADIIAVYKNTVQLCPTPDLYTTINTLWRQRRKCFKSFKIL
jgi:hypothetical protein